MTPRKRKPTTTGATRTESLHVRMTAAEMKRLKRIAARENRTVSNFVQRLINTAIQTEIEMELDAADARLNATLKAEHDALHTESE